MNDVANPAAVAKWSVAPASAPNCSAGDCCCCWLQLMLLPVVLLMLLQLGVLAAVAAASSFWRCCRCWHVRTCRMFRCSPALYPSATFRVCRTYVTRDTANQHRQCVTLALPATQLTRRRNTMQHRNTHAIVSLGLNNRCRTSCCQPLLGTGCAAPGLKGLCDVCLILSLLPCLSGTSSPAGMLR